MSGIVPIPKHLLGESRYDRSRIAIARARWVQALHAAGMTYKAIGQLAGLSSPGVQTLDKTQRWRDWREGRRLLEMGRPADGFGPEAGKFLAMRAPLCLQAILDLRSL